MLANENIYNSNSDDSENDDAILGNLYTYVGLHIFIRVRTFLKLFPINLDIRCLRVLAVYIYHLFILFYF